MSNIQSPIFKDNLVKAKPFFPTASGALFWGTNYRFQFAIKLCCPSPPQSPSDRHVR